MANITAGYVAEIDVLNEVSLTVAEGAITGIVCANGAGKSTILKSIFGFLHPRQGKVKSRARRSRAFNPTNWSRWGSATCFRNTAPFPSCPSGKLLRFHWWPKINTSFKSYLSIAKFPPCPSKYLKAVEFLWNCVLRYGHLPQYHGISPSRAEV